LRRSSYSARWAHRRRPNAKPHAPPIRLNKVQQQAAQNAALQGPAAAAQAQAQVQAQQATAAAEQQHSQLVALQATAMRPHCKPRRSCSKPEPRWRSKPPQRRGVESINSGAQWLRRVGSRSAEVGQSPVATSVAISLQAPSRPSGQSTVEAAQSERSTNT